MASPLALKGAYCELCFKHFLVSHGGFNDITCHVNGAGHQQRFKDCRNTANLTTMLSAGQAAAQLAHSKKVTSAEIMMCEFIAMHNMSFQAMDHLSSLLKVMFPDSAIASNFACKHTKTKSIVCDEITENGKKLLKITGFNTENIMGGLESLPALLC